MEKLLIVNADDFGLSKGQNYGILESFRHGVVTSTTALVNGPAVEHAVRIAREHPRLAVGLHFVLTLGTPLTPMPGLAQNGRLGKWIWQQAEKGALPLEEIAAELASQYQRFIDLFDRAPTHIDSHHHVHMIPQLFPLVAQFAAQRGVALRVDQQTVPDEAKKPLTVRRSQGFSSEFYGEDVCEALFLQTLDASTTRGESSLEIMCHPAFIDNAIRQSSYCYPRLAELEVLTSPALKKAIAERGYRLGTFLDV
ncbi:chitin disaccharide deacetylase [Kosakonia sp.]|uniref:chitin disaccharide deacetylase n=1 Tax=Kosakonia sp. TaxID=1916651 RepID=UPI0028A1D221|nr:chitin disaccharide deacetylase [Kosakonia sp.]